MHFTLVWKRNLGRNPLRLLPSVFSTLRNAAFLEPSLLITAAPPGYIFILFLSISATLHFYVSFLGLTLMERIFENEGEAFR